MLALLHHPRTLFESHFDAEAVSDHLFAQYPRTGGCRPRCDLAHGFAQSGAMHLAREADAYIVTAALPGVKAAEISRIELVGNRTIRLEVKKPVSGAYKAEPLAKLAPADSATATTSAAAPDLLPDEVVVVESQSSAADNAPSTDTEPAMAAPCVAAANLTAVVVMDKSLTLPQLVDGAGITCSYQDGLLRIVVPMAAPTLDDEHRELIAALEQEHKDAATQVASLQQQLREQKEKAIETQMALRSAQVGVHRAAQSRRHTLIII